MRSKRRFSKKNLSSGVMRSIQVFAVITQLKMGLSPTTSMRLPFMIICLQKAWLSSKLQLTPPGLEVNPAGNKVLLTERTQIPRAAREKAAELMYEVEYQPRILLTVRTLQWVASTSKTKVHLRSSVKAYFPEFPWTWDMTVVDLLQ